MNGSVEDYEAQQAAFCLVGNILRSMPEREWVARLAEEEIFTEIPYANDVDAVKEACALLSAWSQGYRDEDFDALYQDYLLLIAGIGKPLASPWESTYSETGEGLMFQCETLAVRRFYRMFGFQIEKLHQEPDDHIAYEMEFVAKLAEKTAAALAEDNQEQAEKYAQGIGDFAKQHLVRWVPLWTEKCLEKSKTDFYRGIALLAKGFAEKAAQ